MSHRSCPLINFDSQFSVTAKCVASNQTLKTHSIELIKIYLLFKCIHTEEWRKWYVRIPLWLKFHRPNSYVLIEHLRLHLIQIHREYSIPWHSFCLISTKIIRDWFVFMNFAKLWWILLKPKPSINIIRRLCQAMAITVFTKLYMVCNAYNCKAVLIYVRGKVFETYGIRRLQNS